MEIMLEITVYLFAMGNKYTTRYRGFIFWPLGWNLLQVLKLAPLTAENSLRLNTSAA